MNFGPVVQSIENNIQNENHLFTHIIVPLSVYQFYCFALYFSLPYGVNKVFVTRSIKIFLPITAAIFLIYAAFIIIRKIKPRFFGGTIEVFSAKDLLLPLLPLTPIVQYIINNTDILSALDILIIVSSFFLLASIPILLIPRIVNIIGAARPVLVLGLAYSSLFTNMPLLSVRFQWYEKGSIGIQLLVLFGLVLISWILTNLNLRNLLYLIIGVNFLVNSVFQFINRDPALSASSQDQSENILINMVGAREPETTPNIYLLIYDAYVISDTMENYGIDNLDQERYLEAQGFKIYPKTYSYWGYTLESMSRVFNSSLSFYGNKRRATSGDGVVQNLLQSYGYKTFGVFGWDYFSRGRVPSYDYSFPDSSSSSRLLAKAVFLGELRFDLEVKYIPHEEYIELKQDILEDVSGEPRFIYTHSFMPGHSQNSGVCQPNEIEMFAERLTSANLEMKQDIEIIRENDPGAIIIIAGDHGPELTKTCTYYILPEDYGTDEITRHDIQDRLGTFLAIRWPSENFDEYDEIQILQDIFPAIFAYLFEDQELLEARIDLDAPYETEINGIKLLDGIIYGGVHDGEALFPSGDQ